MKKIYLIFIIFIGGCAEPPEPPRPYYYWAKEGVSEQAARDQLGYCRHDVRAAELSRERAKVLVGYCMRSKGYTLMRGYR